MPDAVRATQRDVADYLIALASAGEDCRQRYEALRDIVLKLEGLQ